MSECEGCGEIKFETIDYPVDISSLIAKLRKKLWNYYQASGFSRMNEIPHQLVEHFNIEVAKINKITELFVGRNILFCENCELGFVNPPVSEPELDDYYNDDYWHSNETALGPLDQPRVQAQKKFIDEAGIDNTFLSTLEFGSADARLSRLMNAPRQDFIEKGKNWKELLKHLGAVYNTIQEAQPGYDLLLSSHSFEHVGSLEQYLNEFKRVVKPQGHMFFEVPNNEIREECFKGELHIPHTYFFTPKAMEAIAERYSLKILQMKTFGADYIQYHKDVALGGRGHETVKPWDENPKGIYLRVLFENVGE